MAADGRVDRGRSAITEVTFAAEFEKFTLTYFVPREVLANTRIIICGRFFNSVGGSCSEVMLNISKCDIFIFSSCGAHTTHNTGTSQM